MGSTHTALLEYNRFSPYNFHRGFFGGTILTRLIGIALIASSGPAAAVTMTWDVVGGGNGHTYHAVFVDSGITWAEAEIAAREIGPHASLASITSARENSFVFGMLAGRPEFFVEGGIHGPWVGARQRPGSIEPTGGWEWVTGEPFSFADWGPGEPNNTFGGPSPGFGAAIPIGAPEDFLHLKTDGWNDIPGEARLSGFIAEVTPVPLPAAGLGLVSGIAALIGLSGGKRRLRRHS